MTAFSDQSLSAIIKPVNAAAVGVGASQTAVVKLLPGLTYAEIIVRCTAAGVARTRAQLEADLGTIRLSVSGDEKINCAAIVHIAKTEFYQTGAIGDTGNLVIPFCRLWMNDAVAKMDPNYGTDRETSVVLELEQTAASGIDKMEVFVRLNPKAEPLGAHIFTRRFTVAVPGAGKYSFLDLPANAGEELHALHIYSPDIGGVGIEDLSNIALLIDGNRMIDTTQAVLASLYKLSNPVRTPQTAKHFAHLDFTARGFGGEALPVAVATSQELELTFDTAVATRQVTILGEYGKRKV